jgi:uncharacterized RDD family membrane protein YckC
MPEGSPPPESPRRSGPLLGRLIGAGARSGLRGAQRVAESTGLDQAAEEAVAEAVVRALESPAAERAMAQALESPAVERSINRTIDSEMLERVWGRVLESDELQKTIERVAESPEVRSAIASQGFGLIDDIGGELSRVTRRLDMTVERIARAIFRRPKRAEDPPQAGVLTRALAFVLDAAIVNLALLGFSSLVAFALRELLSVDDLGIAGVLAGSFTWIVVSVLYLVGFWGLSGETPGMRFFNLRLEGPDGPRLGRRRARKRLVGLVLAALPFGLGFVPILFNDRRRGLQDRIADTEVRYVPPRREGSLFGWETGDQSASSASSSSLEEPTTPKSRSS